MPHVFYMPNTRSGRVLWTLEEIGIPYETTQLAPHERREAAHRARHPLGRVPAIQLNDGTTMFESAAICLQLADQHPDSGLMPAVGTAARARVYQWVLFAMTELEASLYQWLRERRDGTGDDQSNRRFTDAADALQDAIADKPWLLAHQFTVADIICISVLQSASARQLLKPWPTLQRYVKRGEARPARRAASHYDRPPIPESR